MTSFATLNSLALCGLAVILACVAYYAGLSSTDGYNDGYDQGFADGLADHETTFTTTETNRQ